MSKVAVRFIDDEVSIRLTGPADEVESALQTLRTKFLSKIVTEKFKLDQPGESAS